MELDSEFEIKLSAFKDAKRDILFAKYNLSNCTASRGVYHHDLLDIDSKENYTSLPPLEFFMGVPNNEQVNRFYQSIKNGDVVVGVLTSVDKSGLYLELLSVDVGQARHIWEHKIEAFCSAREAKVIRDGYDFTDEYAVKDYVRGVVTRNVGKNITISFNEKLLPYNLNKLKLGLLNEEDLSLYYSRSLDASCDSDLTESMHTCQEHRNPSITVNLAMSFGLCGLKCRPSLLTEFFDVKYDEEDFADNLKKRQSYTMAMKSVSSAADYMKKGKDMEAMQLVETALKVDPDNVEGRVVLGALYGNKRDFKRAAEEFEAALKHKPNHSNARSYLASVLIASAKIDISNGELDSASKNLRRARHLNDNDDHKHIEQVNHLEDVIKDKRKSMQRRLSHSDKKDHTVLSYKKRSGRYYSTVDLSDDDLLPSYGPPLPPRHKKRRHSSSSSSSSSSNSSSSDRSSSTTTTSSSDRNSNNNSINHKRRKQGKYSAKTQSNSKKSFCRHQNDQSVQDNYSVSNSSSSSIEDENRNSYGKKLKRSSKKKKSKKDRKKNKKKKIDKTSKKSLNKQCYNYKEKNISQKPSKNAPVKSLNFSASKAQGLKQSIDKFPLNQSFSSCQGASDSKISSQEKDELSKFFEQLKERDRQMKINKN